MARYNLNAPEAQVVTSWLYEVGGYLDNAINNLGVSARLALVTTPTLNVTDWIRTNTPGAGVDPDNWAQCSMIWWIRASDGVNITPQTVPPEKAAWVTTLQAWDASIADGFVRVPQSARDANTVPITAADGSTTTRPAGLQLIQQRSLFGKVIPVLQQ